MRPPTGFDKMETFFGKERIMSRRCEYRTLMYLVIAITIGAFLVSCGPAARKPTSQLDTPEHHVATGVNLIKDGKYVDAQREFDLALQLEPKFSMAHSGLALAKAYQGDFKGAFSDMDQGWKYAKTDEEKVFAQVGYMRLYTMSKENKKWLDKVKDAFDKAVLIDPKSSAAYYFMGIAYKQGLEFNQAGQMFTKVLDLKTDYLKEADIEWNLVQKIQRAMPGTITGKKIAIVETISRADAAALFMEEMRIDILYKKRTPKTFDTSFKDPEKAKAAKADNRITSTDIAGHPLKADVEGILNLGVRGLENYPDNAFHPDELITRGQYAMMLEDILIKVTGDEKLATKFIGSTSPFPDLRSDLPYFNAVMVVTSRGIMEAKDFTTGEFAPIAPVSGADALLIIKKFKEELRFDR